MRSSLNLLFLVFLIAILFSCSRNNTFLMSADNPLSKQGTVSFLLNTDKTYMNGIGSPDFQQTLFKLPGLASCDIYRSNSAVDILFMWEGEKQYEHCSHIRTEKFPGPVTYSFVYTWDSEKGIFESYVNGKQVRFPGITFNNWDIVNKATEFEIPAGPIKKSDFTVTTNYTNINQIKMIIPKDLLGKNSDIVYVSDFPEALNTSTRKGKLLYNSKLDNEKSIENWILEGPGIITFEKNNKMKMKSMFPDQEKGHFNLWCPQNFPDSFILEWEYKSLRDLGFNHIFFASKGIKGQDIFSSDLEKRDGTFKQYINGDFNNYFIAYYSHLPGNLYGRSFGYLQKNTGSYILNRGPIAIKPGSREWHKLTLIKDKNHIQLQVDGVVCIDYTDNEQEWFGKPLKDGKIGFRQMSASVGFYKNFNVWELVKD